MRPTHNSLSCGAGRVRGGATAPPTEQTLRPATEKSSTTSVEKALLAVIIISLPLESHILIIPGYSVQFVMFGIAALYLGLNHPSALLKTMGQPVFVAAYLFLLYSAAMEMTAPHANIQELVRIGQMIVGAVLIAAICRDLGGLKVALLGYLAAGLWLSVLLFLTSYGAIQGAAASNFQEASMLRQEVFADNPLQANLNNMAFAAGQGAVVALAWALTARTHWVRNFLLAGGLLCLIATFLPLSRGGIVITIISCASVMYGFGLRHAKSILMLMVVGGVVLIAVPDAVWSRMAFSFEEREGKTEGRALVYQAAMEHLPDYIMTGVGSGNFWSSWGAKTEFKGTNSRVSGSHNSFFQVTLYWGIGGLLTYLLVFWQAYRCLPRRGVQDVTALCLLGIGMSLLLYAQVIHNLYAKEFCLGLGLLAGARCWVWPNGVVPRKLPDGVPVEPLSGPRAGRAMPPRANHRRTALQ